jgi:hypothetical protein
VEVRDLVAQDVADYFEALKLHPRNFNNQLSMLRTFFGFCQTRGWLSKHADLLSRVERRFASGSDIEIFTPGELRALLAAAPPRCDLPRHPGVRGSPYRKGRYSVSRIVSLGHKPCSKTW